ncbi:sigma-70 family RNA polymerase sigma factor [Flavobacterium muglaense]|uniref:Sigma-70 family RNA polymerase sigma factor n=1 Tax=Flavobacterium muglaense TaxID=2764716 RepID=A0A923MX15_9FLAO|nr:sigma-70 family RNA polymerase sigma factor [Flavobacterium muglaense]MBC5836801.1 sigma-70 family RNA polymerase sigma factor [Flavobacterium muglaense]MBC5843249.1 sigma-70 family RNA polymerase sigma factor [Flavobacterium muglaense]
MKIEKKQIQKLDTFELTLKNAERYIQVVAQRFNIDEHYQDLLQIGRLALYESFTKHQEDKGTFHGYTINLLRGRMLNYINDNVKVIRIPQSQLNVNHTNHNPNNPTSVPTINTSTPISEEGSTTIGDMLAGDEVEDDNDDEKQRILTRLKQSLSKLKQSHQQIIMMRYVDELNVEQIAEKLGISKQAVSQQLQVIMKKLKNDFGVNDDNYKSEIRITKEYQNNEYKNYKKYDQSNK